MLIATDNSSLSPALGHMLEGYDCPAILVSPDYQILASNRLYQTTYGEIDTTSTPRCYAVSHGYSVPCDRAGESCPLVDAKRSGHKERVLHVHQTPRGKEHVDVEMLPIHDTSGDLIFFVELLKPVPLAGGADSDIEMVGTSAAFNRVLGKIARVGPSEAAVLLLGETGTGKELAARAIHLASTRNRQTLVTLECAGLSDALFESELFGHVKGAFTGAHSNKKGLVELADGGTLFLDEIGDVPLTMQIKLLRLLESGTYRPVGSADVRAADFRLVCATHKNLAAMVATGAFRSDLYYRINVFPINLPPLAQRREDIPLIAKTLLARMRNDEQFYLTESAMQRLIRHQFKGNIRELRNLLQRATVLADTNVIDRKVIEECFEEVILAPRIDMTNVENKQQTQTWVDLRTAEGEYLTKLLRAHEGDKNKVAEVAGISLRSLYRRLENLNTGV